MVSRAVPLLLVGLLLVTPAASALAPLLLAAPVAAPVVVTGGAVAVGVVVAYAVMHYRLIQQAAQLAEHVDTLASLGEAFEEGGPLQGFCQVQNEVYDDHPAKEPCERLERKARNAKDLALATACDAVMDIGRDTLCKVMALPQNNTTAASPPPRAPEPLGTPMSDAVRPPGPKYLRGPDGALTVVLPGAPGYDDGPAASGGAAAADASGASPSAPSGPSGSRGSGSSSGSSGSGGASEWPREPTLVTTDKGPQVRLTSVGGDRVEINEKVATASGLHPSDPWAY